jgi:predicted DNA-binding transcriptional regulator AlpA
MPIAVMSVFAGEIPSSLGVSDLAKLFNVSERHIRRLQMTGRLPEPIRLGKRCLRWPRPVIEEFARNGGSVTGVSNVKGS